MLLAIDIGNTTIGLAIMTQGKVRLLTHVNTSDIPSILKPSLRKAFEGLIKRHGKPQMAAICSVVPTCTVLVERYIKEMLDIDVKVVGRDINVPMKNCYKNPAQVGQDRLVGAYAAMRLYGKPLIVVDLGTAITFDVVSAKGEYLGGAIVPGLRLSAESLFVKTALLPEIALQAPKNPIGTTTQDSILSGLFYGYGTMCQGMIDLLTLSLRAKRSNPVNVVMTGGHTHLMKRFVSPKIRIIDDHLVFKGISLLMLSLRA